MILSLTYQKQLFMIGFYFLIVCILALTMILLSYFLAPQNPDEEKLSGYECGFSPFGDARIQFDVHFYIVGLLFLIFDLEIIFLIPWTLHAYNLGFLGYLSVLSFLAMLALGFLYEWWKGAIDLFEPIPDATS